MKRQANPQLTPTGEEALTQYEQTLQNREDLTPASIRNYLSDLHHFLAWYETCLVTGSDEALSHRAFDLQMITTPALTRYRAYLQKDQRQKPTSVNRALISFKRYFAWAMQNHRMTYDPSATVKLVGQEETPPRHLDDEEEQALVAAVTKTGILAYVRRKSVNSDRIR